MTNYCVTGGAGFIGSHFCKLALKEKWCSKIFNIDALTYAGNLSNIDEISRDENYQFHRLDLASEVDRLHQLLSDMRPDVIVHFAAESHVDRSIQNPDIFLKANIWGTFNILEFIRKTKNSWSKNIRFIYISTDEVYGSIEAGSFADEAYTLSPSSPYSASKASADLLAQSYFKTFDVDAVVVRGSNNFGPNQLPEKLIPKSIIFSLESMPIPIFGEGQNCRDWIFVEDFIRGVQASIAKGKSGRIYNLGSGNHIRNIDLVRRILDLTRQSGDLIQFVNNRKGHDFRYALNCERAREELSWDPKTSFDSALKQTIDWYESHGDWWKISAARRVNDF